MDIYSTWIRSVAELTAHAFNLGAVAQHSAHYLLLFWTKMVIASAAVVQSAGATAHILEQLLPQVRVLVSLALDVPNAKAVLVKCFDSACHS